MHLRRSALLAAVIFRSLLPSDADAAFPTVALKPIALKQIHAPTAITYAPGGSGRLFVCDQVGKIHIIQNGVLLPTPFLNIANPGNAAPDNGPGPVVPLGTGADERGLLGLAFHPGYNDSQSPGYRRFYVNYNKPYVAGVDPAPPVADHTPNCVTVIAEFQVSGTDANVAVVASERRLLVFTQPQSENKGGQLEFGPDGFLYIGCGDGGSSNDNNVGHTGGSALQPTNALGNGQDRTTYLGKILRIDPLDPDGAGPLTYSIPNSNPFYNDATPGLKKEIYATGLRNPSHFSFDTRPPNGTNRLFSGDIGQSRIEEINLIASGGNFAWRYREGTEAPTFSSGAPSNPMADPGLGPYINAIARYGHPGTTGTGLPLLGLAVTGGYVYRGAAIPALQGKYVFGNYGSTAGGLNGRIMGLEETAPVGSGVFTLTAAVPFLNSTNPVVGQHILCLGEDESGEIYLGMKTNAGVLALDGGLPAGGIYKIVPVQSSSVTITADKDNTIFSESGSISDGHGYVYAGRTGTNYGPYNRRGLVSFNVGTLPAGAVVQSAQLKLFLEKAGPDSAGTSVNVHRLTETWGEGTSVNYTGGFGTPATTNDATWSNRFFNTSSWSTPGGAYSGTVSATTPVVPAPGLMTWGPTTQLRDDVRGWITTPSSNAGWIVIGDELTLRTACQYHSRQYGATPPELALTYDSPPPLTRRESWSQQYFLVGQYVDDLADLDGDGIVNGLEYAYAFSPLAANAPNSGLAVSSTFEDPNTIFVVSFRRDPRALDLSYILEASSDLIDWDPIVQSLGGGASGAVGGWAGDLFEDAIPGETPMILVTVREVLPSPSMRFVRLRVVRTP